MPPSHRSTPSPSPPTTTHSRTPPRAHIPGTEGPDRGGDNGPIDEIEAPAAAAVTARLASAVRRYPPGCGRGVAVSKPEALVVAGEGESDAVELLAAVCDSEAKAIAGDQKLVLCGSTLDSGESGSNFAGKSGGDGDGALEGCGRQPWIVSGIMSVPFLPWAQHQRRLQQRRKLFRSMCETLCLVLLNRVHGWVGPF